MQKQTFEIKIAVFGYVSVGKTTVLNALFKDKYSEVSMRRTTAGINFFRVLHKSTTVSSPSCDDDEESSTCSSKEWSPAASVDKDSRNASSTLREITDDNAVLREKQQIQEKEFTIEIRDPLCEMRKDTRLVFVDIPGVNEAGVSRMYKDYVAKMWKTYDCVIIVMDAAQDVNTDEQVQLLEFVKKNNKEQKAVPVIILCNKVDNPNNPELAGLVKESREKVETIFEVPDRAVALEDVVQAVQKGVRTGTVFPAFIPISAKYAFLYRSAPNMTFDEFKNLDVDLIDDLGSEEVPRSKWRKLSQDEKYEVAFGAVRDPSHYREPLESTNFHKFLAVLSYCVGGDDVQRDIIEAQIKQSLQAISPSDCVADHIRFAYHRCVAIDKPICHLKEVFWNKYRDYGSKAAKSLADEMKFDGLIKLLDEVITHSHLASVLGGNMETERCVNAATGLVRHHMTAILAKENQWRFPSCAVATGIKPSKVTWECLSPHDWMTIIGSVLLLRHESFLYESFGRELIEFERLLTKYHNLMDMNVSVEGCQVRNENIMKNALKGKYIGGKFVPDNTEKHKLAVQITLPAALSDRTHWGHLAWKFCNFMSSTRGRGVGTSG